MADTTRSVTVKVQAVLDGRADPFGRLADSAKKAQGDVDRLARSTAAVGRASPLSPSAVGTAVHAGRSPTSPTPAAIAATNPAALTQTRQQADALARSGEKAGAALLRAGQGVNDLGRGLLLLSAGNKEMEQLLRTLLLVQGITDTFKGLGGIVGGLRDAAAARGAVSAGGSAVSAGAAGAAGAAARGGGAAAASGASASSIAALPIAAIVAAVSSIAFASAAHDERSRGWLARNTAGIPGLNSSWVFNNAGLASQEETLQRMRQGREWLTGVLREAPGAVAPWDEDILERELQAQRPFRERERAVRSFQRDVRDMSRVRNVQFREERRQQGLQDRFQDLLQRGLAPGADLSELLGVTRDASDVAGRRRPRTVGGRPLAPEVIPAGLGGELGQVIRGDFAKGNAASEQALLQATSQWERALGEVDNAQRRIAEQQRKIAAGERTRETSLAAQRDLQEQLAAANQRLLDADMRRTVAARDHGLAEIERLSTMQKQVQESQKLYQAEAQRQRDRLKSLQEEFGIQDLMTQQSVARIAGKLGGGGQLSREELEIAKGQSILADPLRALGARNAADSGLGQFILQITGQNNRVAELERAAAALKDIDVKISNKIEAEFVVNETALAEQFAKQVLPVIQQAILQVREQLKVEIRKGNFERAANVRTGAEGGK